jgi:uncharacterized protein (DUF1501 family)
MKLMNESYLNRRGFLSFGTLAAGGLAVSRFALASAPGENRLCVVILRGALDGLSAVPPVGDPDYARLRGSLALARPGAKDGALALTNDFGLHPALAFLHEAYRAKEMLALHAVATPYRERSHFDAQDVLENGGQRPHQSSTGWLNRALATLPGATSAEAGVALGNNVPLIMRGTAQVASWAPSTLPAVDDDTLQRIMDLYANDPVLGKRLADALANDAIADEVAAAPDTMSAGEPEKNGLQSRIARRGGDARQLNELVRTAAAFLARPDGPKVAVFETRGWDTHANQGDANGQLALRLRVLDSALRELRQSLGSTWKRTAVLLVTEFGRTASTNGTRGTDHGTGAGAFLVGGAVNGGRVIADWPGLSARSLYQGRDLAPTLDLRAVFKGAVADHLGVATAALERDVFPDSASARPVRDLIRS